MSPAALQPESREVANNVVVTASSSRATSPLAATRSRGAAAAERFLARQASSGTLAAVTARGGLLTQYAGAPKVFICEEVQQN